jgi:uncharacterized membrane protein YphA (DoxX/SURF4 family)
VIVATLAVRWLLAVVLITAAIAKLGRSDVLGEAISRYDLLPASVVPTAARALPVVELLLGISLMAGVLVTPVAIACACLFGIFAAAVAINLAQGQTFDCGCGLGTNVEISWSHVARSMVLVALSVLVAVEPAVLALNAGHVAGVPAARELIAVPLGVLLLCVSWRLIEPLRDTISFLGRPRRSPASIPSLECPRLRGSLARAAGFGAIPAAPDQLPQGEPDQRDGDDQENRGDEALQQPVMV